MSPKKKPSSNGKTLRYRAENVLKTTSTQVKKMSLPEIQHLVHELQVHQVELEMQNEELRQTQLELQQARDRYADLYDFAPVGFLTLNAQGQILEANLPACQLLGVERKALLRQKFEKFVMATDQHILRQHLHQVEQQHNKEISDVIRLKHNATPYVVRLGNLYEEVGLPNLDSRFRIALLDLTEQEKTKRLQKEQEVWVSAMLDSAMDAIIMIDRHKKIVLFNASAEQMFGCATKEALGQSLDRFIPKLHRKAHADHIKAFERGASSKRRMGSLGEVTGLRANGEEFPLEASISRARLDTGTRLTAILRDITERRMIEESLRKEQEFVATMLNTTAAFIVVLDSELRIIRFNQKCEQWIGKTFQKMSGKPFHDLPLLSGKNAKERKSLLALFKDRILPERLENAWIDRDRQLHWIKWSNTAHKNKNGKIDKYIATGIDITQRKKTEQEIHLLLKQNESILNSAWEGIYGLDHYGKATFFNRSAERLTGWTAGEVQGQFLHSLLHHTKPDGRHYPWKKCPVYLSLTHGNICSLDNEVLWCKDGTSFQVEYTSMPVYSDKKKVEGVVVTFRDITARKKADEALRTSEERFQAFMSHSPTVTFLKDKSGHYVFVNLAFEKLLNKSSVECLGKTDQQLFHPEVAHVFREHDRRVLEKREILEAEEITLDDEGNRRDWWVVKFPVQSKENQLLLGGVALDISDQKKAQEALLQRKAELQESQKNLQALGGKLISAQEDERRRISRELHDDMNQRLAVLAFNIQSAQNEKDISPLMDQTLQKLYDGVSSLSDDVRHLAYQLHPSILDDLGLEVALRSFLDDFSKWEGVPATFTESDMPVTLPHEVASCLYRVAQEGMRNVSRHAQATQVNVRMIGVDGGVRLSIQDNGKGFGIKERELGKHGLGLIGMEERVRVVQGTYEVKSVPGRGTKITVWVPIPKEESL